jgi:tetratricopeptide (TPR) repeat protein
MRLACLALPAALLLAAAAPAAEPLDCAAALAGDPAACDAAIAAEGDSRAKAELLFHRAYALVERSRYEDALASLDEAIRLAPDYADAYHERAYTLGELREFDRALKDSDREVALRPEHALAYSERAYLRQRAGNLEGAYPDRARVVELKPGDSGALLARSAAALWLGRFDEAMRDAEKALRLARNGDDRSMAAAAEKQRAAISAWRERSDAASPDQRCRDADRKNAFSEPRLVGDCTAAFLAERSPAKRAELLTIRSVAWLVGYQDEPASVTDEEVAVALDPGNAKWHANLGASYVRAHHSWAGRRELDRSLAVEESWMALAERAEARYNLHDPEGAFADAKRSIELEPNEIALVVLGDLAHDRGDQASARLYWMGAWHLGSRDDGTLARLKSIGIDRPEREPKPK